MKLSGTITGTKNITVLDETDWHVVLAVQDMQTGAVQRVDISADMAVLPDEALLSVRAMDMQWRNFPQDYQDVHYDDNSGDIPVAHGLIESEYLPPTWTITPDGQEVELRAREGGLF